MTGKNISDLISCVYTHSDVKVGERAREEVQREARRLHRPEEDPPQAHQEGEQAEAEEAQVPHPAGRPQLHPGWPRLPRRDRRKENPDQAWWIPPVQGDFIN